MTHATYVCWNIGLQCVIQSYHHALVDGNDDRATKAVQPMIGRHEFENHFSVFHPEPQLHLSLLWMKCFRVFQGDCGPRPGRRMICVTHPVPHEPSHAHLCQWYCFRKPAHRISIFFFPLKQTSSVDERSALCVTRMSLTLAAWPVPRPLYAYL